MAESTTTIREIQGIPQELVPYFTGTGKPGEAGYAPGLLGKGQEIYGRDYATTYAPYLEAQKSGFDRVSGLGLAPGEVGQAGRDFYTGIMGLQRPEAFNQAAGYLGDAATGYTGIQGQTYQPFGADQAQQYMSTYAQSVTDIQKRKAIEDAQRAQLQANLGAGRRGSLGSSGQLLATTERERALGTQLGDIQAKGLQEAFLNAQLQYERDRNAQFEAGRQQLAAAQGLGSLGTAAAQLGTLGQAADIDRLKMLGAYADVERGIEQQRKDIQYQDLMRQIQLPEQQLMGMTSLLRGVPMGDRIGTTSATTPPPSFASQLTGAGLTGLSLYNLTQPR